MRKSRVIRQLLILLFASVASAQPSGVFSLFGIESDFNRAKAWNDSFVTGVAVRTKWSTVEPAQGTYSWAYLDSAVAKAQSSGKKVVISVIAGCFSPTWVYNQAHQILTLTGRDARVGTSMPAPWDSTYLSAWTQFISNLGARYGGLPAVAYFTVTGLGHAEECYLCADPKDSPQFNAQEWLSAARQIVSAYEAAAKGTPFVVAWGLPAPGQSSTTSGCMYQLYTISSSIGFKADSLSATFPTLSFLEGQLAQQMGANGKPVVFQALHPSHNGADLGKVIQNGETMNMGAFECYKSNVNNPDCQQVLAAFNSR
jgi:Beta-galactosidase